MKLLILLTLTLTLNISLITMDNSHTLPSKLLKTTNTSKLSNIAMTIIDNETLIYEKGIRYFNKIIEGFLTKVTGYSDFLIAMIEDNNKETIATKKVGQDGNDQKNIKHSCFY